jgi:hypothetical protein
VNTTIQNWLNALVPMPQIVDVVNRVLPSFVLVAVLILLIGYYMGILASKTVVAPSGRLIALFVCIAGAPWLLRLGQQIANGLVGAIAGFAPSLNWLLVPNPGDSALAMDFTKPFGIIGKYVGGNLADHPGFSPWELNKWADYLMRAIFILLTGLVACFTVFVMQAMLILQKLIIVFSKPLLPIWIACLSLPAAHGSAQNFLKSVVGVMCWPVGWAIVHIGTMAALQALQPPNINASLGELLLAFAALCVACLWPVVGTIGAPFLIAKMVTSGSNFAHSLASNFASVAGQHAAGAVQAGAGVAGALIGSGIGGAPGAALGASVGAKASEALSLGIGSITQSAEGLKEGRQPVSTSRSKAAADAAIGFIKTRSK